MRHDRKAATGCSSAQRDHRRPCEHGLDVCSSIRQHGDEQRARHQSIVGSPSQRSGERRCAKPLAEPGDAKSSSTCASADFLSSAGDCPEAGGGHLRFESQRTPTLSPPAGPLDLTAGGPAAALGPDRSPLQFHCRRTASGPTPPHGGNIERRDGSAGGPQRAGGCTLAQIIGGR
mmetsp:Transcript_30365/g.86940  ORF Transcript_30365/g.86940 Transcript_30365/m.86940 type:complete len:175 (+) Transcript_30365:591-1115(+)